MRQRKGGRERCAVKRSADRRSFRLPRSSRYHVVRRRSISAIQGRHGGDIDGVVRAVTALLHLRIMSRHSRGFRHGRSEMPPNSVAVTMLDLTEPPRMCPTSDARRRTIFWAIPHAPSDRRHR